MESLYVGLSLRCIILDLPMILLKRLQKLPKNFWNRHHWMQWAILYLLINNVGKGLIELASREAVFHLQAIQCSLFEGDPFS